jgi:hypothetical protein
MSIYSSGERLEFAQAALRTNSLKSEFRHLQPLSFFAKRWRMHKAIVQIFWKFISIAKLTYINDIKNIGVYGLK